MPRTTQRVCVQVALSCALLCLAVPGALRETERQVATVEMPEKGYLSAAIYDADGALVGTLFARSQQPKGSVALKWDGRDDLGRLIGKNSAYTWKALFSRVESVEQSGIGDSQFTPVGGGMAFESNDQVDCIAVNATGGIVGDVGGVFARNTAESSFGDTKLEKQYTLDDAVSGGGLFYFSPADAETFDGQIFVGHYSSSAADDRREFIGMEVDEGDVDGQLKVRARFLRPECAGVGSSDSDWVHLPPGGYFRFSYKYDPATGQLTLQISNEARTFDHTIAVTLAADRGKSGAAFDAFGIGIAAGTVADSDPAKTAKFFIDDVSYTGHTGALDFSKDPGWVGAGNTTSGNKYGWSASETTDGSIYQASQGEEGSTLRRISTDSKPIWQQGGTSYIGIAANATHVFVSQWFEKKDRIIRVLARDGSFAPFSRAAGGVIMVNSDEFDPRPKGQNRYTPEQYRQQFSLWGMAADSRRVWVSNHRNNRVEVYDAVTGLKLGEIPAESPIGVAVEIDKADSGAVWVAHHTDRVSRFTYTVKDGAYAFTEDAARRIANLREPSGLSIGGPQRNLFIGERATGKVLEYDIRPTPPVLTGLKNTFGSLQRSGPMKDTEFRWHRWAGVAVDHAGILNVVDDRRIQRFFTRADAKKGVTAGELYQSWWGEFGPAPIDTFNYTADGKFTLVSGNYEYEVDPEYTGGPRKGWLNDGTWRVVSRFLDEQVGVRRTLSDNGTMRDYRFTFDGTRSVCAYELGADGIRMAAIVGFDWTGVNRDLSPQGGLYNWTDADGDGAIDWGGAGSGTSGEVTWNVPLNQAPPVNPYSLNAGWVDYGGNVWVHINRDIVKVPLEGFDARHNPIYNWANRVVVVPFQDDQYDFMPRFTRVAANGDIYSLGTTKFNGDPNPTGGSAIHGGDWLARHSPDGKRLLLRPIVDDNTDEQVPASAFDENDPKSQFFAVGNGEGNFFYIRLYTNDGLLVGRASSEQGGIYTGWIDHQYGVGYFSHPVTKKTYLFGEDIVFGRSVRYRVDGLDTIQRKQGSFKWTTNTEVAAHWPFEDAGNPPGAVGKAVQVGGGGSDNVELPFTPDPAAYTISAWVKPKTAARGVNVITRASEKSGNQDMYQLRINRSGKFEHSIIDGTDQVVAGLTTVQPDMWYHVVLTAESGGAMRLYVNGKEDGVARSIGTLTAAGDRFRLGAKSIGYAAFEGLVDEVRVYEAALDAAEVRSLYSQAAVVTVTATDPRAAEGGGDAGAFAVSRSNTRGGLVVHYTLGGTAAAGSDFKPLPGTVTIPDGEASATVAMTPVNDTAKDPGETVILTLAANAAYLTTSPRSATVAIVDDDTPGDPGWVGVGNRADGNDYGWSESTSHAGGTAGEIGGTFARNDNESYYADTHLAKTFTLDDTMTASGKLTVFGQVNTDQEWVLGHISTDTADSSTLGIELMEGDDGSVKFAARAGASGGTGSDSEPVGLANGKYDFTYTYDPKLGPSGRVTVRIHNATVDRTAFVDITAETRAAGATFDAFGIGIKNRPGAGDDAGKTIKMFVDDVTYSGKRQ